MVNPGADGAGSPEIYHHNRILSVVSIEITRSQELRLYVGLGLDSLDEDSSPFSDHFVAFIEYHLRH